MESLPDELFCFGLEFVDTMGYVTLSLVSKIIRTKCLIHKKDRMPFIVCEELYIFGDAIFTKECLDEFYDQQFRKFNTWEKIHKKMDSHLHQLLFCIIAAMGLRKASKFEFPLRLYTVPWRFRKCIDFEEHDDRYYMKIDTELYITSYLEKCEGIIKNTPTKDQKEIKCILFQKIMQKYKKSVFYEMYQFNEVLIKKLLK